MVFIATHTPIEQIYTIEDISSQDWFLLQTNINLKSLSDEVMYQTWQRIIWYPYWYTEKLHLYLMTDKYYYKTQIYNLLPHTCMHMIHKKMPRYIKHDDPEYMSKYPMVENITITESDITNAFETLFQNNFKENPIIHTTLGETEYE